MNLKQEFIALVNKNIAEHERKSKETHKMKGKILIKTGMTNLSQMSTMQQNKTAGTSHILDQTMKEQSFFDQMNTETGLNELLSAIMKILNLGEKSKEDFQQTPSEHAFDYVELDEYKVIYLFKELFDEIDDFKIMDLFELFELKTTQKISLKEIVFMILYVTSVESNQMLEFLYIYGEEVFSIISNGKELIPITKMKQFAKILGYSERKLQETMKKLHLPDAENWVNYEVFEMVLFALFEDSEEEYNRRVREVIRISPTKKVTLKHLDRDASATCKPCMIF